MAMNTIHPKYNFSFLGIIIPFTTKLVHPVDTGLDIKAIIFKKINKLLM